MVRTVSVLSVRKSDTDCHVDAAVRTDSGPMDRNSDGNNCFLVLRLQDSCPACEQGPRPEQGCWHCGHFAGVEGLAEFKRLLCVESFLIGQHFVIPFGFFRASKACAASQTAILSPFRDPRDRLHNNSSKLSCRQN